MKNFIILLFVCFNALSQPSFELTKDGFVDVNNKENTFLIIECPGLNSLDIYNKTLQQLHVLYKNPDEVLSSIKGKSITIHGIQPNAIRRVNAHVFDLDYSFVLRFKEGKMRIDAPTIKMTTFTDKQQILHVYREKSDFFGTHLRIFTPKKIKSEKAKLDLEKFFNSIISSLYKGIKEDSNDDW